MDFNVQSYLQKRVSGICDDILAAGISELLGKRRKAVEAAVAAIDAEHNLKLQELRDAVRNLKSAPLVTETQPAGYGNYTGKYRAIFKDITKSLTTRGGKATASHIAADMGCDLTVVCAVIQYYKERGRLKILDQKETSLKGHPVYAYALVHKE